MHPSSAHEATLGEGTFPTTKHVMHSRTAAAAAQASWSLSSKLQCESEMF